MSKTKTLDTNSYYSKRNLDCQYDLDKPLHDFTGKIKKVNGKDVEQEHDWRGKKLANEMLARAYHFVDQNKELRLLDCSTILSFDRLENKKLRLKFMNSCRVRLCPLCSWRRAKKTFYNTMRIVDWLKNHDKEYKYIFVTLTVKNCTGDELNDTVNLLYKSWDRFMHDKIVAKTSKGYCRCMEITHDANRTITEKMYLLASKYYDKRGLKVGDENPNFDMFHPHFHVLFCVNKSYFSKGYVKHDIWVDIWQRCLQVDYSPSVYIEACKSADAKVVAEVSKYAVKDTDLVVHDDWDLTVESVRVLDRVLANRRLIAYGGNMKYAFQQLKLEDSMDGNLVKVGEDVETDKSPAVAEEIYFWHTGYNQYFFGE